MKNVDNDEPKYMQMILREIEEEEAKWQEETVRAVDACAVHRCTQTRPGAADRVAIAQRLAMLHEGLTDWIGLMEEDMLLLLYLVTIAKSCLVYMDGETDAYKSALIIMAGEEDIVVMASTEDASIMAWVGDRMIMELKLPYAHLIDDLLRRCYNMVSQIQTLETIAMPTGEYVKVLFEKTENSFGKMDSFPVSIR